MFRLLQPMVRPLAGWWIASGAAAGAGAGYAYGCQEAWKMYSSREDLNLLEKAGEMFAFTAIVGSACILGASGGAAASILVPPYYLLQRVLQSK